MHLVQVDACLSKCKIVNQHIGFSEHGFDQGKVGLGLQIEADALLAAIEPGSAGAEAVNCSVVMAHGFVMGTIDLDDASARIHEPLCAMGRGDIPFDRDNGDSGQWTDIPGRRPCQMAVRQRTLWRAGFLEGRRR